jgi:hypothetical protein
MRLSAVQLLAEVLLEKATEGYSTPPPPVYPPLQPRQLYNRQKDTAMEVEEEVLTSSHASVGSIQLKQIVLSPSDDPESLRDLHLSELMQSEKDVSVGINREKTSEETFVNLHSTSLENAPIEGTVTTPTREVSSPSVVERYHKMKYRQKSESLPIQESLSHLIDSIGHLSEKSVAALDSNSGNNILDDDTAFPFMNQHTYQDDLYWAGQVRWRIATPTATATTTSTTNPLITTKASSSSRPSSSWWGRRRMRR